MGSRYRCLVGKPLVGIAALNANLPAWVGSPSHSPLAPTPGTGLECAGHGQSRDRVWEPDLHEGAV